NPLPGQGSSTIWFPSASTTNAGAQYVQASNSSGTTNSPPAPVTVTPDFDGPGNVYLVIGSDTAIWNYASNAPTTVDAYTRHPYYSQKRARQLTQPAPACSVGHDRGLSQDGPGVRASVCHGRCLSRLPHGAALAGGFCVSALRWVQG